MKKIDNAKLKKAIRNIIEKESNLGSRKISKRLKQMGLFNVSYVNVYKLKKQIERRSRQK